MAFNYEGLLVALPDPIQDPLDALLQAQEAKNRVRIGLPAKRSEDRPPRSLIESDIASSLGSIANRIRDFVAQPGDRKPPRATQQRIDFDKGDRLRRRLIKSSETVRSLVYEIAALDDVGISATIDDVAERFEVTVRAAAGAIRRAHADGLLEVVVRGRKQARFLRTPFELRGAISGWNVRSTQDEALSGTYVPLKNDPQFGAKPKPEKAQSHGTTDETRARHDSDRMCNGIIFEKAQRRKLLSKRQVRALSERGDVRPDYLKAHAALRACGIDTEEARYLACCHAHADVAAAIHRCEQERMAANNGKRPPITNWSGFVHRSVSNTIMRPEVKALLAQGSGADS